MPNLQKLTELRDTTLSNRLRSWMADQGWSPLPHQMKTWEAIGRGSNGLLAMPTGAGKTYAVYLGILPLLVDAKPGLKFIYITPLRALSRDIEIALKRPVEELGLSIEVGSRTGDTSSYRRQKQRTQMPDVLVTTPESLALLLSYPEASQIFQNVQAVVVDEWHELLSTKRGSLLELSLSHLRKFAPQVLTWALSATLPNREQAAKAVSGAGGAFEIIQEKLNRPVEIETILPAKGERIPWAGHMGLHLLPQILEHLDLDHSSLIFTNTRFQAERWYQALCEVRPEWQSEMAVHHGSLDRDERTRVETGIKSGTLRIVVATSSLDLGIDLPAVDRVFQIGSPKGIGRLIQRAGRASHAPGKSCRIYFVPTHAFELVEISACREALAKSQVEARTPLSKPLDVLAQHLVTCALGGGFERAAMLAEVRKAYSFRSVTEFEFDWVLELLSKGGKVLHAYPQYRRVVEREGRYTVEDRIIAQRHRLNIGTIVSNSSMSVKLGRGKSLGTLEESFIAKLRRGDPFVFAGRHLELVRTRELTAYVKLSKKKNAVIPVWDGGKLPFSASLSLAVREELNRLSLGEYGSFEVEAIRGILEAQSEMSALPKLSEVLVEVLQSREGSHLFLFPFEGRAVHEGVASLLAYRLSQKMPVSFSVSVNDYGFEILCPGNFSYAPWLTAEIFSPVGLVEDIEKAVHLSEMAKRQFREVARVAGLLVQNVPGQERSTRQLQASGSLLFDVFMRYDPENLLVRQAKREVIENQFEQTRLYHVLERVSQSPLKICETLLPTPLAFPLVIERIRAKLSSESVQDRIQRMQQQWENRSSSKLKTKPLNSSRKKRSIGLKEKPSS